MNEDHSQAYGRSRSSFGASGTLPPIGGAEDGRGVSAQSHASNEDAEFFGQYTKQRKARAKYTKKWEGIRSEMQAAAAADASLGGSGHRPKGARRQRREGRGAGVDQPPPPPELFSHFSLNKDPEVSKYMPYDSVAFPKLERMRPGPSNPAELESMWMSGFLDNVQQNAVKLSVTKVGPLTALPGPGILPKVRKTLAKLEKRREKEIVENADYTPRFEDVEAKEQRRRRRGAADEEGQEEDQATGENVRKALSTDERAELKRLVKSLEPVVVKTAFERNMDVYRKENRKIKRVLAGDKPKGLVETVACDEMAGIFEVNRKLTLAATTVSRWFRRALVRKQWKVRVHQVLQSIKIQAAARGFVARRLVAAWYQERMRLAIQWQARVRGWLRVLKFRRRLAREIVAATHIQRGVRALLGRRRFLHHRRAFAACVVQRVWRGCVGRGEADRRWLTPRAVTVQRYVRGLLARFGRQRNTGDDGGYATKIQRVWRGFFARKVRNVKLFDRETVLREQVVAELASDASFFLEVLQQKSKLYKKAKYEEKEQALAVEEEAAHAAIKKVEANFLELNRQRRQLSPRGINQGWREELNENLKQHRQEITKLKLNLVFGTAAKLRALREARDKAFEQVKKARRNVDCFGAWREQEVKEGLERENHFHHEREHEDFTRRVAHERRKWQVRFYKPSGKPDKWRRPGRPWDPRAFAGQLSATYTGGAGDVFAFNQSVDSLRVGSDESLKRIMGQVQTQNFLNEVQSMESLLQPLVKPLQAMQHEKPLWEEQQERSRPPPEGAPWLPTSDDLGLPYEQATTLPPNPLRPVRYPSFPAPAGLEAKDNADLKKRTEERQFQEQQARLSPRSRKKAEAARAQEEAAAAERRERVRAGSRGSGGGGGSRGGGSRGEGGSRGDSRMSVYGQRPEKAPLEKGLLEDVELTRELRAFAPELERRKARVETEANRARVLAAPPRTRKQRYSRPVVSRIPWTLLDELEAEKYKLKAEKAVSLLRDKKHG